MASGAVGSPVPVPAVPTLPLESWADSPHIVPPYGKPFRSNLHSRCGTIIWLEVVNAAAPVQVVRLSVQRLTVLPGRLPDDRLVGRYQHHDVCRRERVDDGRIQLRRDTVGDLLDDCREWVGYIQDVAALVHDGTHDLELGCRAGASSGTVRNALSGRPVKKSTFEGLKATRPPRW